MSIELVAKAKKTKLGGDSTAKLLLICLADYANDQGMAWPSVATMTDEVEKKERTIQNSLRKLERLGRSALATNGAPATCPRGNDPPCTRSCPRNTGKANAHAPNVCSRLHRCSPLHPSKPPPTRVQQTAPLPVQSTTPPPVQQTAPGGCSILHQRGAVQRRRGVQPTAPKP